MIDTISIVGHGPSLIDKGVGKQIDLGKYVIRFPHIGDWQKPEDYGERISYYFGNHRRYVHRMPKLKPENGYIIWSKFKGRVTPCEIYKRLAKSGTVIECTKLIKYWQNQLKSNICAYLSNGSAAIIFSIVFLRIPVMAFGFDNLSSGDSSFDGYTGSSRHEKRKKNENHHDFACERDLVLSVSGQYQTRVYWYDC
jgi:hypothetical protein